METLAICVVSIYFWVVISTFGIGMPIFAVIFGANQIAIVFLFKKVVVDMNTQERPAGCSRKGLLPSQGEQTVQEEILLGATMVAADLDRVRPCQEAALLQPEQVV